MPTSLVDKLSLFVIYAYWVISLPFSY